MLVTLRGRKGNMDNGEHFLFYLTLNLPIVSTSLFLVQKLNSSPVKQQFSWKRTKSDHGNKCLQQLFLIV